MDFSHNRPLLSSQTQTIKIVWKEFFIWFLSSNYVLFTCFLFSRTFLIILSPMNIFRLLFSFTHTNARSHICRRITFITLNYYDFVCVCVCFVSPIWCFAPSNRVWAEKEELAPVFLFVVICGWSVAITIMTLLLCYHFICNLLLPLHNTENTEIQVKKSQQIQQQSPGYGSEHTKLENIKWSSGRCMSITFA